MTVTKTQRHSRLFNRVDTYDEETGAYIHSHMERRADAGLDICMTHTNINTGKVRAPMSNIGLTEAEVREIKQESDEKRKARTGLSSLEIGDAEAAAVQKTQHRVTFDSMLAKIADEEFIHPETIPHLTICVLTTDNGFALVGKSAPADPDNFDEALGKKFAREDAIRQMWVLEGYLLRERLSL